MSWFSWRRVGSLRVFGWLKFNLQFLFLAGCRSQLSVNFRSYTISNRLATNRFVDVNIDECIEGNLTRSWERLAWKLLWPPFLSPPPSGAQFLNRVSLLLGFWHGACCCWWTVSSAPLGSISGLGQMNLEMWRRKGMHACIHSFINVYWAPTMCQVSGAWGR